jgi:hypothetical protein
MSLEKDIQALTKAINDLNETLRGRTSTVVNTPVTDDSRVIPDDSRVIPDDSRVIPTDPQVMTVEESKALQAACKAAAQKVVRADRSKKDLVKETISKYGDALIDYIPVNSLPALLADLEALS